MWILEFLFVISTHEYSFTIKSYKNHSCRFLSKLHTVKFVLNKRTPTDSRVLLTRSYVDVVCPVLRRFQMYTYLFFVVFVSTHYYPLRICVDTCPERRPRINQRNWCTRAIGIESTIGSLTFNYNL